jgi:predicted TIM-barrel fold metal-dependent hydrolase
VVSQLELQLDRGKPRVIGEVYMRQVGRRLIDRDPNAAVFGKILETAAKFAVPIVIHYELTDQAETALGPRARRHRKSTIVLAHGGEGPPGRLDRLLLRNPNLFIGSLRHALPAHARAGLRRPGRSTRAGRR